MCISDYPLVVVIGQKYLESIGSRHFVFLVVIYCKFYCNRLSQTLQQFDYLQHFTTDKDNPIVKLVVHNFIPESGSQHFRMCLILKRNIFCQK